MKYKKIYSTNEYVQHSVENHSHTISDVTDLQTALDEIDAKTTMVVTLNEVSTFAGNAEPTFTIDKTFEEISNHINNGGNVVLYDSLTANNNFKLCTYVENEVIVFSSISVSSTDFTIYTDETQPFGVIETIVQILPDNSVTVGSLNCDLQNSEIYNLNTTNKTVIGAINEVNDKASVQPDWNQNDEAASDYIKNRTHYAETVNGVDFTWDGNFNGISTYDVNFDGNTRKCIKVSDVIPTNKESQIVSGVLRYRDISSGNNFEVKISDFIERDGYLFNTGRFPSSGSIVTSFLFIVTTENGASSLGLSDTGIYANFSGYDDVCADYYFEAIHINGEEKVVKLDEKYIPEMTAITLLSPNGTRFSITVGDDGVLTASEITE